MSEKNREHKLIEEWQSLRNRLKQLESKGVIQKQMQQEMIISNDNYQILFDRSPCINLIVCNDKTICKANQSVQRILQYSPDEITGTSLSEHIVPWHRSIIDDMLFTNDQKKIPSEIDIDLYDKNGTVRTVLFAPGKVAFNATDASECILLAGIDITELKLVTEVLEESDKKFKLLIETMNAGFCMQDIAGIITYANEYFCSMIQRDQEDIIGHAAQDFVIFPEDLNLNNVRVREMNKHREAMDVVWETGSGGRRHSLLLPAVLTDDIGNFTGTFSLITDISQLKETELALIHSAEKLEKLHVTAMRMVACDTMDDVYEHTIESAEEILGLKTSQLGIVQDGKFITKAHTPDYPIEIDREFNLNEGTAGKTFNTGKTFIIHDFNKERDARIQSENFRSGISSPIGKFGVFQVVSEEVGAFGYDDARMLELLLKHTTEALRRIQLQDVLKVQANQDPLTGVYNRFFLKQVVKKEVQRARRYDRPIAIIMIDVIDLKTINDKYGHQTGDDILLAVANILIKTVRENDIVVRYGGDEFLILLPETNGEVELVKDRIKELVTTRNEQMGEEEVAFSLSIGTASWDPAGSLSIDDVFKLADRAMYDEKRNPCS